MTQRLLQLHSVQTAQQLQQGQGELTWPTELRWGSEGVVYDNYPIARPVL